MGYKLAACRD